MRSRSLQDFIDMRPDAREVAFLDSMNQGLSTEEWKIHCVRFAPNCPEQNPRLGYLVASQNLG